ncbi:SIR2 family protein [Marinitoga sp. 1155]|uniref:SIR2 family protein n=1 Tax=Marinitoga sp. 1155 TaxID=1428448 RepID=UPI0006594E13|nr:SIR2 family protein [Marinitoga sp. 1155]KLO21559.1 hypothetical protein X274_10265 [Marinitoga sp. 1155]
MEYIYDTKDCSIKFTSNELKEIFEIDSENSPNVSDLSSELVEYIEKYGLEEKLVNKVFLDKSYFSFKEKESKADDKKIYYEIDLDKLREIFKRKTESIRNDIISKFLLSENLNFLIGNGCSRYAGSKTINEKSNNNLNEILEDNENDEGDSEIKEAVKKLKDKRPEEVLDNLLQIRNYYRIIKEEKDVSDEVDNLIKDYKKQFIKDYVETIDYQKNAYHKMFLKRIVSREGHLNRANIFTLNYDLLIEKSAEELGIIVNNGFHGFTIRKFNPSFYNLNYYLKNSDGIKTFNTSVNLFKLHGSLTWIEDEMAAPYGIVERQPLFKNGKLNIEKTDYIIYPIQTKIKQSLDLPYSELFRAFVNYINRKNSTLIVMGYSFLDVHVNDIIANALSNPDFNLVVFSYAKKGDKNIPEFLEKLFDLSREDSRITIFSGPILGRFEYIVEYLIPYYTENNFEEIFINTLKKLKEGDKNA